MKRSSKQQREESRARLNAARAESAANSTARSDEDRGGGDGSGAGPGGPSSPGASDDFAAVVGQLRDWLVQDEQSHPCRPGWRSAKSLYEDEKSPFGADLERLFEQAATSDGQGLSLHHLAIVKHGRAIHDHLGGASDVEHLASAWKDGLQAWAAALASEACWQQLSDRWGQKLQKSPQDPLMVELANWDIKASRDGIEVDLLSVHASIACAELREGRSAGARLHLQLIDESGFQQSSMQSARTLFIGLCLDHAKSLAARGEHDAADSFLAAACDVESTSVKLRTQRIEILNQWLEKSVSDKAWGDMFKAGRRADKAIVEPLYQRVFTSGTGATSDERLASASLGELIQLRIIGIMAWIEENQGNGITSDRIRDEFRNAATYPDWVLKKLCTPNTDLHELRGALGLKTSFD